MTASDCSNGGALASIATTAAYYNCILSGNRASGTGANPGNGGNGGALCFDGGSVSFTICGCTMRKNTAGALATVFRVGYNNPAPNIDIVTIQKTWIDGNSANSASGLYMQDVRLVVSEVTISNGVATTGAGGHQIFLGNWGASFDWVTWYRNTNPSLGGGGSVRDFFFFLFLQFFFFALRKSRVSHCLRSLIHLFLVW